MLLCFDPLSLRSSYTTLTPSEQERVEVSTTLRPLVTKVPSWTLFDVSLPTTVLIIISQHVCVNICIKDAAERENVLCHSIIEPNLQLAGEVTFLHQLP